MIGLLGLNVTPAPGFRIRSRRMRLISPSTSRKRMKQAVVEIVEEILPSCPSQRQSIQLIRERVVEREGLEPSTSAL